MSVSMDNPMPSSQTTRRFVNSFKTSPISGAPYRIENPRQAETGRGPSIFTADSSGPASPVKRGGCTQQGAAMRTPEDRYARQPASPLELEFPQFLIAGRADWPFVVFGFGEGQFGSHSL